MHYSGLLTHYADFLPIGKDTPIISLHEGNTPLIPLRRLSAMFGGKYDIYAKFEGLNPTGSFKDRGMTLALSKAVEQGSKAVLCASTGNTSASAAAYSARANIACFVLIPEGKIALGKLAQAIMHGAHIVQISGNFDEGLRLVKELAQELPLAIVNSINPYRLQGQKTIAFEIIDALGNAPDYHFLPVGNAGNISAHWMGYCEYQAHGRSDRLPKMVGYQASGAAPFLRGHPIESPETLATAIRIGAPASWDLANKAQSDSGGWFGECSDAQILDAQRWLATHEGIFCEPASAVCVAGLFDELKAGRIPQGSQIVCTLTGHGLKDPDIVIKQMDQASMVHLPADRQAIVEHIGPLLKV